jgi:hypothetical protein
LEGNKRENNTQSEECVLCGESKANRRKDGSFGLVEGGKCSFLREHDSVSHTFLTAVHSTFLEGSGSTGTLGGVFEPIDSHWEFLDGS